VHLMPCSYREASSQNDVFHCALAQRLLGLDSAQTCRVGRDACTACAQLPSPTTDRPNSVVASLVYDLASQIQRDGGREDCDYGSAAQAKNYVQSSLTDIEESSGSRFESPIAATVNRFASIHSLSRGIRALGRRRRGPVVGLVGFNTASGLGYLNRDLAERGVVDSWLVVEHPHLPTLDIPVAAERHARQIDIPSEHELLRWLRTLDWVIWAEICPVEGLTRLARRCGTHTACIPMWEWTSPLDPSLRDVDLVICPTRHAFSMFSLWRQRFGFRWQVAEFPWPISGERFRFRVRQRCERFLFINGYGGAVAREFETGTATAGRKGADLVLAAAAMTPEINWTIVTQTPLAASVPRNVTVRFSVAEPTDLYDDGDVCVQPSRWEGLGLPLLECQAAGMPLVVIDMPPMNEYQPLRVVQPEGKVWAYLTEGQPIPVPLVAPAALANVVRDLHGQDIRAASIAARNWILRERSWENDDNDSKTAAWRGLFN
jgi:glycosyltransferase involved in cell wall biosynthesis